MKHLRSFVTLFCLGALLSFFLTCYGICQEDVDKLHKEALVRDCHNDLVHRVL